MTASEKITSRIDELDDWRGETLARMPKLHAADPEIVEEWKREKPKSGRTPGSSHEGIVCTGEAFKQPIRAAVAANAAAKKK